MDLFINLNRTCSFIEKLDSFKYFIESGILESKYCRFYKTKNEDDEKKVIVNFFHNTLIAVAHYCYSIMMFIYQRKIEIIKSNKKDNDFDLENAKFFKIPFNLITTEIPISHATKIISMFNRK